ncbi:hypothetical protein [Methylomagnum ishizawai]|uniref:hypothetical protein n=1 Tax=Methylomagnum ishizawai TaxID=1760988 RepID=UPI001C3251D7|nr:hypothetical protein [Methylomagnum ishizawai]BBL73667.1 hypothetical protein MishRS11D_07650 [Methylomagnum ishizawai]
MNANYPPIEIASPGKRRALNGAEFEFTPAILAELAEYDPKVHEAPIVLGHPQLDDPAYGWLGTAAVDAATGKLVGTPSTLTPEFAEAVREKRYRKVSVSIYLPDSPGNPRPGKHTIKHVGFFGAHAVADKGLRPYQFAADEPGTLEFSDWQTFGVLRGVLGVLGRVRDWVLDERGQETADKLVSRDDLDYLNRSVAEAEMREQMEDMADNPRPPMNYADPEDSTVTGTTSKPAEFAEREQNLKQKEDALKAREAALKAQEQAAEQRRCADFAEQLVQEGKLLPRDQAGFAGFLASLPADAPLEFGEGEDATKTTGRAWFESWSKGLPKRVDFGEWDKGGGDGGGAAPSDQEVARRARAYKADQEAKGNYPSFAEAVDAVHNNLDRQP